MTKSKLEQYLNKTVTVRLFDGETLTGKLRKTGEECFKHIPELYLKKNCYVVEQDNKEISFLFKSSHVKSLKKENEDEI